MMVSFSETYLQLRILLEHGAQSGEPCRNLFLEFEKKIIGLNLTKKPRYVIFGVLVPEIILYNGRDED